jgi:hypothetical protein
MRLLPRTRCGTWMLAIAFWLTGCGALWCVLPSRPRAAWATEEPAHVHGFIPGTSVVLTSSTWIDMGTMGGPLLARDAATGEVREWFLGGLACLTPPPLIHRAAIHSRGTKPPITSNHVGPTLAVLAGSVKRFVSLRRRASSRPALREAPRLF